MLVNDAGVPPATQEFLEDQANASETLHVFGGTAVIPDSTVDAAKAAAAADEITAEINPSAADLDGRDTVVVAFSEPVNAGEAEDEKSYTLNNSAADLADASYSNLTNSVELEFNDVLTPGDVIAIASDAIQAEDGSPRFVQPTSFTVVADTTAPTLTSRRRQPDEISFWSARIRHLAAGGRCER